MHTIPTLTVSATLWRRVFVASSLAWAALLPLAAIAVKGSLGSPVLFIGALAYAVGADICHQIPERSFHVWSQQLPVCARCTGIYLGAAAAAVATLVMRSPMTGAASRRVRIVLVVAALPTIATIAYEWALGDAPSNIVRALAGFPLGAAASFVVLAAGSDRVN